MKRKNLDDILSDKTSGSAEIVGNINEFFKNSIDDLNQLKFIIPKLRKQFKIFATVQDYLSEVSFYTKQNDFQTFKNFTSNYRKRTQTKFERIYNNAKPFIAEFNSILTISNSRTLLGVFKLWRKDNPNIRVFALVSNPGGEGKIFTKHLKRSKIFAELIQDENALESIKKSDTVIIGADTVLQNGSVVNKVGSKALAKYCKEMKKPFIVFADNSKFTNKEKIDKNSLMKINEDSRSKTSAIPYFELINSKLITKIFTD